MLDLGVILIAHIEGEKAISEIENTTENTEFLFLQEGICCLYLLELL